MIRRGTAMKVVGPAAEKGDQRHREHHAAVFSNEKLKTLRGQSGEHLPVVLVRVEAKAVAFRGEAQERSKSNEIIAVLQRAHGNRMPIRYPDVVAGLLLHRGKKFGFALSKINHQGR